ncbi:MAG: YesL family protein [Lachnospiraceae bacterium]
MKLFNMDGGLMKTLSKMTDVICLSIMFVLCCIPIITIGTAATALYYTMHKVVKHERGYIFREYVSAFKSNFKHTTPIWLFVVVLFSVLGIDIYIMNAYAQNGSWVGGLAIFFLVVMTLVFAWSLYLFAYIARFETTRKQAMKNALLMTIAHLPWTIVLIFMGIVSSLILYIMPVSICFIPGIFVWIETSILDKIFWKYMSEEDRKAEEERNREYLN